MKRAVCTIVAVACGVLWPSRGLAYHDQKHGLVDYTAHSLNGGELRLGLFEQNVGIHRYVQVGTETLPWVAGVFLRSVAPNANLKVGLLRSRVLELSVRGAFYYAYLAAEGSGSAGRGAVWIVPASLAASARVLPWLSLHAEGTYTWISAGANVDVEQLSVQGTGISNSLQLGAMLEARVNSVVAVTLRGRMQPHTSPTVVRSRSSEADSTRLDVDAKLTTNLTYVPMALVAGLALSWKHVNVQFGMGFGHYFIPSLGIPIPAATLVPDGSFFFRF